MPQTLNGPVWNDDGPTVATPVGVQLQTLLDAALRIAGITKLPGITGSGDQYGELIPALNRMLSSYSLDGHKVYSTKIQQFPLTSGQKEYTIGPGGDFDTVLPNFIQAADVLLPTSPIVRWQMSVITDAAVWARVQIQDISGAPPLLIYFDHNTDDNGRGKIEVWFQPDAGYILELYTWRGLKDDFTDPTDTAIFPDGYEEMIVWNLGVRTAGLYPLESKLQPDAKDMARRALTAVITLNSSAPRMSIEAGMDRDTNVGNYRGWLDGPFGDR